MTGGPVHDLDRHAQVRHFDLARLLILILRAPENPLYVLLPGKTQAPGQTAQVVQALRNARLPRRLRMDETVPTILPSDLDRLLGTAAAPILVDIRTGEQIDAADRLIPGAIRKPSDHVQAWWQDAPPARPVVVCDLAGGQKSRESVQALIRRGIAACLLAGGFAGWRAEGLPTRRVIAAKPGSKTGSWVTRERPKIDRIACPWLIRRFINPGAEFIYVPAPRVRAVAAETGATPYDVDGVEFTHEGERCSFDTILRIFDLKIPALDRLATIVRGADTSRHDLAPQCGGLFAISLGLSANFPDDHEMLAHGMVIYDALYAWCRSLQAETHNWPPAAIAEARGG
jgi:rhodanese-related sulfurtransferase